MCHRPGLCKQNLQRIFVWCGADELQRLVRKRADRSQQLRRVRFPLQTGYFLRLGQMRTAFTERRRLYFRLAMLERQLQRGGLCPAELPGRTGFVRWLYVHNSSDRPQELRYVRPRVRERSLRRGLLRSVMLSRTDVV